MLLLFSIFLLHSLVTLTTGNMENQMIPEGGNGNEDQIIMTNSMSGGLEMGMASHNCTCVYTKKISHISF